jgi:hypothetical protein
VRFTLPGAEVAAGGEVRRTPGLVDARLPSGDDVVVR